MSPAEILARKAVKRARYQRRYARHQPAPARKPRSTAIPFSANARAICVLRGVPEYLQQVVRMKYGAPGTWGRGRYESATRKGPGRRRVALSKQVKPAGYKLFRRFFEKLS